jgi:hypothetical protein
MCTARSRRQNKDDLDIMTIKETGYVDAEWIPLAQDKAQWRAAVTPVMNLEVPPGKSLAG